MRLFFLLLMLMINFSVYAAAEDTWQFTSANDKTRFAAIINEIRCVVCQNQSIADSNAPLANDLRKKVYQLVIARQSNDEIKSYLVKRYGEFILLEPPLNKHTMVLWAFPLVGLMIIITFLYRVLF